MSYCLNPNCQKPQNLDGAKFCHFCASKLLLGARYRAIKLIGQGGFGRTFLAVDEHKPSKPLCVIKQFFPQDRGTHNAQKASELFSREAKHLDDLGKHHAQIPELLAYFTHDTRPYLVQEFIDGQNLAQEVENLGAFNETKIRALLNDLLPVLQFIHEGQVIHRDIKPENIIRRRADGKLVLVDFGASKLVSGSGLEIKVTVIGSVGYTAPEQVIGKAVFASDLYSLGVTCIYLMTLVDPFDLSDSQKMRRVWRNYLVNYSVSSELSYVLDKLLETSIDQRYQSAAAVLIDLMPQHTSASQSFPTNVFELEPLAQVQWQENTAEVEQAIRWIDI